MLFSIEFNEFSFNISNFDKYHYLMLNNDTIWRMVLQCYYLERNSNTSPHCIAANKISWDYNSAVYEIKLTDFAIKNWVEANSMIAYISWNPDSDIVKILSSWN